MRGLSVRVKPTGAGAVTVVLAIAAVAAAAVSAPRDAQPRSSRGLALEVSPSSRTVIAGSVARYAVTVSRRRFSGAPRFHLRGVPGLARVQVAFGSTARARGTLTIAVPRTATAGTYRLRLLAASSRLRRTVALRLVVRAIPRLPFGVSGETSALEPGRARSLNLRLTNPNPVSLAVTRLDVVVRSLRAPRATANSPCTARDFGVEQYGGPYPLVVPPQASRTLAQLGVAAARQPRITLLDRPVNQDGCQTASITLAYSGSATGQ